MTEQTIKSNDRSNNKSAGLKKPGMSSHLLIPVDFSDMSIMAVAAGFHFAHALNITPVLMHVYPMVWYNSAAMPDEFTDIYDTGDSEILAAIENHDMLTAAENQLKKFKKRIAADQSEGLLPDVKYTTLLEEGIAEDEILNYCRDNNPRMVVMSTRGIHKKEQEVIGSVTAEVMDHCHVPVFAVPENYIPDESMKLSRVLMFCTLDKYDTKSLEQLMNTFNASNAEIWLMPVERREGQVRRQLTELHKDLSAAWPEATFHISDLEEKSVTLTVDNYLKENKIQLIIAPNRKTSIFARLFRPSVAHQCLFTVELPLLALPVGN